jgi:hypothetical protein
MRDDSHFEFIVSALCNDEVGSVEEHKETKLCESRKHLLA